MKISKREILSTTWAHMKNNLTPLIIITFLYLISMIILFQIFTIMSPSLTKNITSNNIIQTLTIPKLSIQQILFMTAAISFITGLNLGFIQICLNILKRKKYNIKQLVGSFHILVPYIITTFFYILANTIVATPGIILLIIYINSNIFEIFYYIGIFSAVIPPFYLSLRLQFYIYFLVDEGCGLIESINKSMNISRGHVYQLFILGIILSIIIQVSMIPYFLGLIITIPFSKLATTYLYIQLNKNS